MRPALAVSLALAALLGLGCKRQKPPTATRVWLGPHGGCMRTKPHPTTGELACWGKLPGDAASASLVTRRDFAPGPFVELAIGGRAACGIDAQRTVHCWSETEPAPKRTNESGEGVAIAAGPRHVCVRSNATLRCFGDAGEEAYGKPDEWNRGAKIRAFALGEAHTCVAYEGLGVICRGRPEAIGDAAALAQLDAIALAAGTGHTCALLANHTVRCWGRNDSGQLGDRTTNDAKTGVPVLDLQGVAAIAAGSRHTCALVGNGTVACWGDNARHQLANGETTNDGHAQMVLGVLGVREIAASADATCARFGDLGEVRCWGANDEGQLGDGSREEHTVPAGVRFR